MAVFRTSLKLRERLGGAAIGLALGLGTAAVPVAASAETLADALVLSYRHSGLLEQNRALLRAADEDVAQAVAAARTAITYSISASATDYNNVPDFNDLSVTASLTGLADAV